MVCTNCKNKDRSLFDALGSIIWYDGHYEWLKELRDALGKYPGDRFFPCPFDTKDWHTEHHAIWMLLVGTFGGWGTSIRSGWIEDKQGCIEFIDAVCKDSWEAIERGALDGETESVFGKAGSTSAAVL